MSRWAGFGRPLGSVGGESSRGRSSRIERAAEIAARSAARCTLPLPVTAPAIATRASAPASSTKAPPSARISAWPDSRPALRSPLAAASRCALPSHDPGERARTRGALKQTIAARRGDGIAKLDAGAEPFPARRRRPVDQARPRSLPCGDSRCPARCVHRSDSSSARRRWPPCSCPPSPAPGRRASASPSRPRTPTLGRTVLTTTKGRTLYSLSAETKGRFICTGACVSTWHPLRRPRRRQADRPGQARHDQAPRRQDPGHLQGPPALQLRRRLEGRRRQRRGDQGRRHLARRGHREGGPSTANRSPSRNRPTRTSRGRQSRRSRCGLRTARSGAGAESRGRPPAASGARAPKRARRSATQLRRCLRTRDGEIAGHQVADDQGQQRPVGGEVGAQQDAGRLRAEAFAEQRLQQRRRQMEDGERAASDRDRRRGRLQPLRRRPAPPGGRPARGRPPAPAAGARPAAPPAGAPRPRRAGSGAAPCRRRRREASPDRRRPRRRRAPRPRRGSPPPPPPR